MGGLDASPQHYRNAQTSTLIGACLGIYTHSLQYCGGIQLKYQMANAMKATNDQFISRNDTAITTDFLLNNRPWRIKKYSNAIDTIGADIKGVAIIPPIGMKNATVEATTSPIRALLASCARNLPSTSLTEDFAFSCSLGCRPCLFIKEPPRGVGCWLLSQSRLVRNEPQGGMASHH